MSEKILIIAEAGVNHNGDMTLARRMIDVAKEAKVNVVKFQSFITENLVTKGTKLANYQQIAHGNKDTQYSMLKRLELTADMHYELMDYCNRCGIDFLSTGFDIESMEFLRSLGINLFKIPSGEITNLPYLRYIGSAGKQVILSTGMSTLIEIEEALLAIEKAGTPRENITLLHCTSAYPTPFPEVNLRAMLTLRSTFGTPVGYSDHTLGIEVAIAAASLGATVIEKHFTLDRKLSGPDHKASLEPNELKKMVAAIRNIELALGDGIKRVTESEEINKSIARKSLVAKKDINRGEFFTEDNLTCKRSDGGISPMLWDQVIGKIATRNYRIDDVIES